MYRLRFSVIKVADGCEHKIFCADGFAKIVLLIGRRVISLSLTFLIFCSLSTLSKRREPLHPFKNFTNSSTFWGITAFLDATATYCSVSCIHFTFASLPPADGRNGFHQCARRAISDSSCSFQKSTRCKHDGGSARQNHWWYCGLPPWERRACIVASLCGFITARFESEVPLSTNRWLKVMRFHDGSSCCSIIL